MNPYLENQQRKTSEAKATATIAISKLLFLQYLRKKLSLNDKPVLSDGSSNFFKEEDNFWYNLHLDEQ